VQYQETDLQFTSRLLEQEGISYFFLPGDRLVLADHPAAFEPLEGGEPIPFRAGAALDGQREAVTEVSDHASLSAGRVTLRDFDPARPSASLEVQASVGAAGGGPELYDYPGEYLDPSEGQRFARVWAEALAASASGTDGRSTSGRLAAGRVFKLLESPRGPDERLLLVEVVHDFHRERSGFSLGFRARPADEPFRAPLDTEEPVAASLMTGVVTGPPGEDIHTDSMGRVKVHFPWDRRLPYDDSCSDWIPVLQDNTGSSSAIPRVGWEVLVSYLEGDPDRPVVLGRLYNGADPFPEPLPAGKTRTALRSLSSPSRAGLNMIRLDDAAGGERIDLHAERTQTIVIGHERREQVLANESAAVTGHETIAIGTDQIITIGKEHTQSVVGSQRHTVGACRRKEVGGAEAMSVGGSHALSVGVSHERTVGTNDVVDALGIKDTVGGMILDKLGGGKASAADAAMLVAVGGAYVEASGQGKSESAKTRLEAIGGVVLTASRGGITESAGQTRTTTVGGLFSASGTAGVSLSGGTSFEGSAGLAMTLHATTKLSLVVGESKVVLEGKCIEVKAETITLKIEGQGDLASDESHLNS
jgi:type VI secretion system secreted protein VgrG